ncbi:MAG: S9 family peptidase [Dysgonamonadaceae bacterium]|jgi:dipeptidyl aminopeptidase/acylaminoacyl peptidase|nr:S9 family peptidase [Dysgonamonadaceae bacterium]
MTRKYFISVFISAVSLFSLLAEEGKKPVGIDFFTEVTSISNLKEKDGNIFFILGQIDKEGNSRSLRNLYQLVDSKPVKLTASNSISEYYFEDNGIIFKDIRDEKDREKIKKGERLTVFQKLSAGLGEAVEWLRLPFTVNQIEWVDKNHFFYSTPYDHHFELLLRESNGNNQEAEKKKEANRDIRVFDELPFWSNGRGDVSGLRTHLYYYDDGKSILLTDTLETLISFKLSPDRKTLLYTHKKSYYGKAPEESYLKTVDVATLKKREWNLFKQVTYGSINFISNDEIFFTVNHSLSSLENPPFYRLLLSSGKLNQIYDGKEYIISSYGNDLHFDKDGVFYVSTVIDHRPLIHLNDKNAKVTFITKGNQINVQDYIPYKDGFLAVATVGQQGSEIYFIGKDGSLNPLTAINKPLFDEHNIVNLIEVTFINSEKRKLNGFVLPPANYEKGKKYPGILTIHGGPKGHYSTSFSADMQYWANQGYAVFFTNPTGSNGRGYEFSNLLRKFNTIDYQDLMDFVDAVLKQVDFVDGNRLGVTGGSYGGLMTDWIIGHTNRFKSAVSVRGTSSWFTFSTTSDIGHTFTNSYWETDIWKDSQLLWDRSSLKYADKVATPTLFIEGEVDYRCWIVEGIQMYYALQYFGVPSKLLIFNGEGHGFSKVSSRIKSLDETTKWFDKYLK